VNVYGGASSRNLIDPASGRLGSCGSFSLEISSEFLSRPAIIQVDNFCDSEEFKRKVTSFAGEVCSYLEELESHISRFDEGFGRRKGSLRQLLYISGLLKPRILRVEGAKGGESFEGKDLLHLAGTSVPVIPDTNLVYSGIHNEAHSGLRIRLPYCVVYEIMARYAETSKNPKSPSAVLEMITYYALTDLMDGRAEIIPSPTAKSCEAIIPTIDPLLLRKTIIATRDVGAFNLWRLHPSTGGSQDVISVLLDSPLCSEASKRAEKLSLSEAYYAILQLAVILRIFASSQVRTASEVKRPLTVNLKVNDRDLHVQIPPKRWLH
jgi:hypothetical protein